MAKKLAYTTEDKKFLIFLRGGRAIQCQHGCLCCLWVPRDNDHTDKVGE